MKYSMARPDIKYQLQQVDWNNEQEILKFLQTLTKRLDRIEQALEERYALKQTLAKAAIPEAQLVEWANRRRAMTKEQRDIQDYSTLIKGYLKKIQETGELLDPKTLSHSERARLKVYSDAKDEALANLRQKVQLDDLQKASGITLKELPYSDLAYLLFKSKGYDVKWYPPSPDLSQVETAAYRYDKNAEIALRLKEQQEHRRKRERSHSVFV